MEKLKHLETILTSDRIDVFLRLAPVAYLVGMASFHIQQAHIWDAKHGLLLMGDYICYWLAAVTVLAGAPFDVYDNDAFRLVAENFVAEVADRSDCSGPVAWLPVTLRMQRNAME